MIQHFSKGSGITETSAKNNERFEKFSSLRANVEKCEACWMGKAKKNESKPVKCKWASLTKISIKILGISFSYDKRLVEKDNFYSLILDCRSLLNIWKQRWLSLAGKIQIFKSLVALKPVYVSTVITVPDNVCETLQSLQKDFVWGGKKTKIKHSTLIGDYRGSKGCRHSFKNIFIKVFLDQISKG